MVGAFSHIRAKSITVCPLSMFLDLSVQVAVRWCTSCDDPFCGECWHLIHLRGKRSNHAYCEIDLKGTISMRAIGPNGEDAGNFQAGAGGRGYGSDYAGRSMSLTG